VPAFVGFDDNQCLYWLHSHDSSGIIHMEPRATRASHSGSGSISGASRGPLGYKGWMDSRWTDF
jgi:hypothetical protein